MKNWLLGGVLILGILMALTPGCGCQPATVTTTVTVTPPTTSPAGLSSQTPSTPASNIPTPPPGTVSQVTPSPASSGTAKSTPSFSSTNTGNKTSNTAPECPSCSSGSYTGCYDCGYDAYEKGNYDGAMVLFSKAINLNPNFDKAYYGRGLTYQKLNLLDMAINDFSRAIQINTNFSEAYYSRGIVYSITGNQQKADEDFRKYQELKPLSALNVNSNLAAAYNDRGSAFLKNNQTTLAINNYYESIKLNPTDAKNNLNRIITTSPNEQVDQLIAGCTRDIEQKTRGAEAYYLRSLAYAQKREYQLAINDCNMVLQQAADPALKEAAEQMIKEIRLNSLRIR
jgi:tetratricopeptide (TPR) repeat protein